MWFPKENRSRLTYDMVYTLIAISPETKLSFIFSQSCQDLSRSVYIDDLSRKPVIFWIELNLCEKVIDVLYILRCIDLGFLWKRRNSRILHGKSHGFFWKFEEIMGFLSYIREYQVDAPQCSYVIILYYDIYTHNKTIYIASPQGGGGGVKWKNLWNKQKKKSPNQLCWLITPKGW